MWGLKAWHRIAETKQKVIGSADLYSALEPAEVDGDPATAWQGSPVAVRATPDSPPGPSAE